MKLHLRTKLIISYIIITLLCIGMISLMTNVLFHRQFRNYIIRQQVQKSQDIVTLIQQHYTADGAFDLQHIENIGMNALEDGMILRVLDSNHQVVWDATVHNNGMCQQMLTNMQGNMTAYLSDDESGYVEDTFQLIVDDITVGTIVIGYYGPYYYTDSDIFFIQTVNSILLWAGFASLGLAVVLGMITSRQITRPITRIIQRAQDIAHGKLRERITDTSHTVELDSLTDSINDMTDALQRQQQFSRQTSSDIAHELRTPLTTIQGNIEAVMDGVMVLDQERLTFLHEEILRINRLVDHLGQLAKYEMDSTQLQYCEIDMLNLTQQVIDTFAMELHKDDKQCSITGESVRMQGDEDKIKQVLTNLVANALQYTTSGGQINIHFSTHQEEIVCQVQDNGIGIPADNLPHIFERFYRVDPSRSRSTGGAGLGLTIVETIVHAHHGRIHVESTPGEGTTFILYFPR